MGDLIWQVLRAEEGAAEGTNNSLIFTFHTICDGCAYSPKRFTDFLKWLKPRIAIGTDVQPLKSILNYTDLENPSKPIKPMKKKKLRKRVQKLETKISEKKKKIADLDKEIDD